MVIKKMVLSLLILIMASTFVACHRPRPPRDAKPVSEKEMDMDSDTSAKTGKPAAGGGTQINESQW